MKIFVAAKLHRITVTAKSVDYQGSVEIDIDLMRAATIDPYEQVHVVNLTNGARWITYALPASNAKGRFSLNGGGARLGEIGDRCVVMTYRQEQEFTGARVLIFDDQNNLIDRTRYAILELGNYIAVAYAGMLIAEQGHQIEKWTIGTDPILSLRRGQELWAWINHRKTLTERHLREAPEAIAAGKYDVVIDNLRPSTLERYGIDPRGLAERHGVRWVSLRSEVDEVSFDAIAQARAWLDFAPWSPFYIGDTAPGLFMAFKAVSGSEPGHFVLGHASCLRKLVEGELIVTPKRDGDITPWDEQVYRGKQGIGAVVEYRGVIYTEPARDDAWRREHLFHKDGRITI